MAKSETVEDQLLGEKNVRAVRLNCRPLESGGDRDPDL
jgi:hypothetical protein